jgi:hypothetical protein
MRPTECGFYTGFMKHTKAFLRAFKYICFDALINAKRAAAWRGLVTVMAIAKILRVFVNKITFHILFQKWNIFQI